ncbi:MAG: N-acetylglucosamine-6-phosphate deacetylase [Kosmotogaceae bacterium]
MKIESVLIADPEKGSFTGEVYIEDKKISKVNRKEVEPNFILMPGFVDLHTHAQKGIDTMYATKDEFRQWALNNFEQGVTTFLPTTVSTSLENIEKIIERIKELPLSISGLHLEGPFVNPKKKGAQNERFIFPSEGHELNNILREPVKLITAAPEEKGFEKLYNECSRKGIIVSLGHSAGDYVEYKKAYDMGVRKITHFPNALTQLHHREIGGTGSALYLDFNIEMIVDGIHSVPEFVDLTYRIKGADKIHLITDSMAAAGMPEGQYELGGLEVFVKNKKATLEDGSIAGSTLLFKDAVKNFETFTNCSLRELVRVSSYNSLKSLGMTRELGRIEEGYTANLVLLDNNYNLKQTVFEGEVVYSEI